MSDLIEQLVDHLVRETLVGGRKTGAMVVDGQTATEISQFKDILAAKLREATPESSSPGGAVLDWYIPEDYGATGNGITNDAAAFQSMIDDMPSEGGFVFLSNKDYLINTQVDINKRVKILGSGKADALDTVFGTQILTTSGTINVFRVTKPAFTISDVAFKNEFAGVPSAGSAIRIDSDDADPLLNPNGYSITRVSSIGFYDGFHKNKGAEGAIIDSYVYQFVRYGIYINNANLHDGGDDVIMGCQIISLTHNATAGIYQESSGGLKILGTKFNARGVAKMQWGYKAQLSGTSVLVISGSSFENQSSGAISVSGLHYLAITGNEIAPFNGNSTYAIDLNNVNAATITGNVFNPTGSETPIRLTNCTNILLYNMYDGELDYLLETGSSGIRDLNDITPPSIVSIDTTSSTTVEVVFNKPVSLTEYGWAFTRDATPDAITSVSGSGTTWEFTLEDAIGGGETVTYSYLRYGSTFALSNSMELGYIEDGELIVPVTVLVEDSFTDSNGTSLSAHTIAPTNTPATSWNVSAGTYSITDNQAVPATSGTSHAHVDAGVADCTIELKVLVGASVSTESGIMFRYQDANNFWVIDADYSNQQLNIWDRTSGTYNLRAFTPLTLTLGVQYNLKVVLSGNDITATINEGSETTFNSAVGASRTKHGVWAITAAIGTKHDDFKISQ